jgi:hypothetical protein
MFPIDLFVFDLSFRGDAQHRTQVSGFPGLGLRTNPE